MPRIANRNNVPSVPVVWRQGKLMVEWRPDREPFDTWVRRIWERCDANNVTRPTEEELDELACTQLPAWACTGKKAAVHHTPTPKHAGTQRAGGCAGCRGGVR